MGYSEGAHWLAKPADVLEPWPQLPCAPQTCRPCQDQSTAEDPVLTLHAYAEGRIGLQRQRNPWRHSHGVAVWDQQGRLQHSLSRHYPWPWPHCPHAEVFRQTSAAQLEVAGSELPAPLHVDGPVLAVAELSGEMFFHWQLELLPRLGRVLSLALERWPTCASGTRRRCAPRARWTPTPGHRARTAAARLRPPPSRTTAGAQLCPAFGRPSAANLDWMEQCWIQPPPPSPPSPSGWPAPAPCAAACSANNN